VRTLKMIPTPAGCGSSAALPLVNTGATYRNTQVPSFKMTLRRNFVATGVPMGPMILLVTKSVFFPARSMSVRNWKRSSSSSCRIRLWATVLGGIAGELNTENVDAINGHEAVALLHDAAVVRLYGEEKGKGENCLQGCRVGAGRRVLHIPRHLATCS